MAEDDDRSVTEAEDRAGAPDDTRTGATDDDRTPATDDDRSLRERANDLAEELAGAVEGPAEREPAPDSDADDED
ncbi:MAG: hypothetical protein ABEJ77_05230 [Halanaeroarchaeum sp.]